MTESKRPTARAETVFVRLAQVDLARITPSGRSIALGLALLAAAGVAYGIALKTSIFAVQTIDVRGGSAHVRAEVRAALAAEQGRSLLRVGGDELERRLVDVADVQRVSYDRAYPNTLRVFVVPERPVLVLRRGSEAWLVSARGRVLRALQNPRRSSLPRVWVVRSMDVRVGDILAADAGGTAAAAVAPAAALRFPGGIREVSTGPKELMLVLRRGLEIRLGEPRDVRLKLAIARRILAATGVEPGGGYLDVSVPERPVLNAVSQVAGTA